MKIILDAMGGDHAPEAPVLGALQAAKDFGAHIILVGRGEEILATMKKNGIDEEEFEIAKRATYGDAIASLNSNDHIANISADFDFSDRELYTYIDAIANATLSDIEGRLSDMMDAEKSVLSVIKNG